MPSNARIILVALGLLAVVCARAAAQPAPTAPPSVAPFPLADTFKLHTDPGADRVLYLDFDGGIYKPGPPPDSSIPDAQTTIPPFGGTLSFSDTNLERIQRIWQRVAEDYAPFALDVTTEPPAEGDLENCADRCGARVSIGGKSQDVGATPGVGGIAPLGVSFGVRTRPTVFVFSGTLNEDEKQVAEIVSRTSGLSFGLLHDGTTSPSAEWYSGHGDWCPIMGDCFTRALSQWSKGEYPNANNTEDDLAKIAAIVPGRADDVPGEAPLSEVAGVADQSGIITVSTDTDTFSFSTAAGPATFTVRGADPATNLNAQLTLLDAGGVVATADDPDGFGATLTATLAAGTYRLRVDGVGDLDPLPGFTDYGSLGRYRITGSHPITRTLGVTRGGTGTGTVTSAPPGIACGPTCAAEFDNGSSVTLSAAADAGSVFAGWSGDCAGAADCTLTMDAARSVTATFDLAPAPTASPTATPTVTPSERCAVKLRKLKRLTLKAAKRKIRKAGCELGTVTRPDKVGKRRKLVVKKATRAGDRVKLRLKAVPRRKIGKT